MLDASIRNLKLSQTWIDEQVKLIRKDNPEMKTSDGFQALAYSLLFETDYDGIPPAEILEGQGEKQIDIIKIEEDEERAKAVISIVQTKYTAGFSSNVLSLIKNGLEWIFESPEKEYKKLKNQKFVYKIGEIRKLRSKYGHEGLTVDVYFVTKGDTRVLNENSSHEYIEEKTKLMPKWQNVFGTFNFYEIGALELTDLMESEQRSKRKVNADIKIIYDRNMGSLIDFRTEDSRAIVCTITGTELARLANLEPKDAIFDLNVRPYYGSRGPVNSQIYATCQDLEQSQYFWFLNNGITMICDKLDPITDPDVPFVRVNNAQIVNGCQTSVSIREAAQQGLLKENVKVLMRIYQTSSADLAKTITLTTNNQNRITDRDLRANEALQYLIQKDMADRFGYFYERKNKEYKNRDFTRDERKRIIPNDKAGQAYLAIVKRKPSQSRGFLAKVWSTYYRDIFENSVVEDLLLSYFVYLYFMNIAKKVKASSKKPDVVSILLVYGTFHLARIAGHLLTQDKWGVANRNQNQELIATLETEGPEFLDRYYPKSIDTLTKIWKKELNLDKKLNPSLLFKASKIERKIEEALGYESDLGD